MKQITHYIRRKTLLYKTGVEYGDYTINHIQGCSHGCTYPCYAYLMAKRFGKVKTYEEWQEPKVVENSIELLQKEIPKYKDKIKSVHLSFTTDPFMLGYKQIEDLSIEIIKILNTSGIKCTALTKGILPRELANTSRSNEFGITLVSLDEEFREKYEPFSSVYRDRIESLRYLHESGCKTWVSIEPYPTPNFVDQNLGKILDSISFVDKIIFGRMNYNPKVREYVNYKDFYNNAAIQVISFCSKNNIQYHIKDRTISDCEAAIDGMSAL